MKDIRIRTIIIVFSLIITLTFISRKPLERFFDYTDPLDYSDYLVEMVDDTGYRIKMKAYPERIISLHPAHTINLFEMDLNNVIIGVSKKDVLPLEAVEKLHFSHLGDVGEILKEKPDLILITPEIERENPELVNQLRRSGVNVFAVYPKDVKDIERYVLTLGNLTGKKKTSEIYYKKIVDSLKELEESKPDLEQKVLIYYEVSEMKGLAASEGSIQELAIELSGGELFVPETVETYEMTVKNDYLNLPQKGEQIEVILSEDGGIESGGSKHSIQIRDNYDNINAVQNNKVYEIDFRVIGLPTIHLADGIKELRRVLLSDNYTQIINEESESLLKREKFAKWLVERTGTFTYFPDMSDFNNEDEGHYYGNYEDVIIGSDYFDEIETVVNAGYLKGSFDDEGVEWFYPDNSVTRDEFALGLYLAYDIDVTGDKVEILDINESEQARIIELLVGLNVMGLNDEAYFLPKETITVSDAIKVFERIEALSND